jgi:hypothetical protein
MKADKYSDDARVAKCQGAQSSYWHIRQVKVKLQNKIDTASKITSYTIEKSYTSNDTTHMNNKTTNHGH